MSPRRKLLVAIVIGVALAGPPVAALNIWLGGLADQQGRGELELTARRHMAIAEGRIGRAVETLNELARRGIDSCGAHDIDALRRATFATTPIKELSITADDGRTLCSDVGQRSEPLEVISSEPLSATGSILLEVVRLDGGPGRWLRIRRPGLGTDNGIAALIPADLFVPQVSTTGEPLTVPAGWAVYRGAPEAPFAIAYPPGWRVDTSDVANGRGYVRPTGASSSTWLLIATAGKPQPGANIDVLRDDYYNNTITDCTKKAIDKTNTVVYDGITFAGLGATCDTKDGLLYVRIGVGLNDQVPWRYRFNAPYGDYDKTLNESFFPMLTSLNIYANP
ncbi:MAG: hypothetical protein J0H89_03770 [Rhizobiales bacterium]|nr:hypothetical protein [Hyphomicrobiales bacterium]